MPPTTAQEIFAKMPEAFRPQEAPGADVVYQFHISDLEPGDWNLVIRDQQCQLNEGRHEAPSVVLTMKEEHWVGLASGALNPVMAFMTGKIKASGDLSAAQNLGTFFELG